VKYLLERGTNLDSPFQLIATNLMGQLSEFVYTDTNVPGPGPFFYRVGVKPALQPTGPIVWAPVLKSQAKPTSANP
jgi:hypothetical protein